MRIRPSIHNTVNCTQECSCGNEKNTLKQWCDECWDLVPFKAARVYKAKGDALARSIVACEKYIKEANENKVE